MLPERFHDKSVCIIGLGYVGLTLAVAMADAGFRVYGVECNRDILEILATGRAHFQEAGLNEKLARHVKIGHFTFSSEIDANIPATVFIVTVGTPVGGDKHTKINTLRGVIDLIGAVLKDDDLVILRSTVRVGTCRTIAIPILDQAKRRYDFAFCPERTLEGRAVQELRTLPQIVGGRDSGSTFRASQLFSFLTPTIVRVNDLETAEMVKLINNTHRDLSFAFANEVAAMCDVLGISANEVISSGNFGYPRANLPLPGPAGGPCLEKDPYILSESLEAFDVRPELALKGRELNEELPTRTIAMVASEFRNLSSASPKKVALLGLAFKGRPETNDLRGTLAIRIFQRIMQEFPLGQVVGWDAIVAPSAILSVGIEPAVSLEDAFQDAEIVVIQNNHAAFELMDIAKLSHLMKRPGIIYDYWCQHDQRNLKLADGVIYRALGSFNVKYS